VREAEVASKAAPSDVKDRMMDSYLFALTYHWLTRRIDDFTINTGARITGQITSTCLILVTIWVMIRGYRIVTGASREPAMMLVSHMIKVSLIVFAAKTASIGGSDLYHFLNTTLPQEINYAIAGSTSDPVHQIDQNLLKVSAAISVIDMVQVPSNDPALAKEKANTSRLATIGIAAPAMSAAALLLMYQIAVALLTGLAPLFILCLIFDASKDLFRRWLMYLLSTLFSLAMLNLIISWVLKLTLAIAEAIWTTDTLTRMTGLSAQGFNTIAFQQGGIGLLMTVLIICTPPMAAALFNGTLGTFMPFPAFGAGGRRRRAATEGASPSHAYVPKQPDTGIPNDVAPATRRNGSTRTPQPDEIKRLPLPDDQRMAAAAYGDPRYWTAQVGPPAPGTTHAADRTQLTSMDLPGLGSTYLDQSFAPRVEQFIANAAARGVNLHFNSAFRTPDHQAALRNDPAAITPAETSLHSCGFAVDVNYSVLPISQQQIIREAAAAAGLSWGGDFRTPDPPHFFMEPPIDRATAVENATRQYNEMKAQ
jgi:type IV secretion system protein VirB6